MSFFHPGCRRACPGFDRRGLGAFRWSRHSFRVPPAYGLADVPTFPASRATLRGLTRRPRSASTPIPSAASRCARDYPKGSGADLDPRPEQGEPRPASSGVSGRTHAGKATTSLRTREVTPWSTSRCHLPFCLSARKKLLTPTELVSSSSAQLGGCLTGARFSFSLGGEGVRAGTALRGPAAAAGNGPGR